jgi:MFS transporter, putative metabolite:H+ symporter
LIAGIGALIVWYLRKSMPESPRWLESKRRFAEAEELITKIEGESAGSDLPPLPPEATAVTANLGALDLFGATLLPRLLVGSIGLIVVNTLIFGFVTWLPTFFIHQGLTLTRSFSYTLIISLAAPVGCVIGAFAADRVGRRPTIVGASLLAIVFGALYPNMMQPLLLVPTGFCLLLAIYVLVALLYGVYTPELFPTELRLRANGICNMLGRGATIVSPFIVVTLFEGYGVTGVTSFMIGLLVILIVAVWAWGIEPAGLALESVASTRPKSDFIKLRSPLSKAP